MTQCELQEEKQQIEDLEHQRVDYLNRAERIAERLTTLKAEHKEHIVEANLSYIVQNASELDYCTVINKVRECLEFLRDE